jgi:hypothetical protein
MSKLEYTIRLAEHGRLAGELLVAGRFEEPLVEAQTKQLVVHSYMAERDEKLVDAEMCRKNAHKPFPKERITYYGNPEAIIIPAGFFLAEIGYDLRGEFPDADIIQTEGITLGKMFRFPKGIKLPKGMEAYEIPVQAVRALGPLLDGYKEQYRNERISFWQMWHIERNLWLPSYWRRTRKIESVRREGHLATWSHERDKARELKTEFDELVEKLNKDSAKSP